MRGGGGGGPGETLSVACRALDRIAVNAQSV
jgi:hypothetical protein